MTKWINQIDDTVGVGATTVADMKANGSTYGVGLSTDFEVRNINSSGISTFTGNVTVGGTLTYDDVTNIDSVGLITARGGIQVTTNGINVAAGICTFPANSTIGGSVPASTGKAIAMAMVFG